MVIKKHEELPVSSIVLNPSNYRHRPANSAEEALGLLFADEIKRAEMVALATDIAQRGLDMSSLPIVQPENGFWRVIEGNRRIAALKVMGNPDILPDLEGLSPKQMAAYRDKFARIGSSAQLPRNVLCFVTDDRELANHLVYLKHTGATAHKGAGTVYWDAGGRARYEMDLAGDSTGKGPSASNKQAAAALNLLDALVIHFSDDDEMLGLIEAARTRGLTIIGRLLLNDENQLRLGVQTEGNTVRFGVTRPALRKAMHRILTDRGTPRLNTRSTNRADQVTDYLDSIDEDLPKGPDRLPEPAAPSPGGDPNGNGTKKRTTRRKQARIIRKAFAGLELYHASNKTRIFLAEVKRLRIDEYPYVLSVCIRTLIDLFTVDVLAALSKPPIERPSERARRCHFLIEPQTTKRKDRQFPRIADALVSGTGDLSIDTMNGFMHRASHNPTPDTIRVQVEYYQPWLKALDDYVEEELTTA